MTQTELFASLEQDEMMRVFLAVIEALKTERFASVFDLETQVMAQNISQPLAQGALELIPLVFGRALILEYVPNDHRFVKFKHLEGRVHFKPFYWHQGSAQEAAQSIVIEDHPFYPVVRDGMKFVRLEMPGDVFMAVVARSFEIQAMHEEAQRRASDEPIYVFPEVFDWS